jgi:hypothetical protein
MAADERPPVPDPTVLTTEQLLRETANIEKIVDAKTLGLRELLEARLDALDMKMHGHFLIDTERFDNIDHQFESIESQRQEAKKDNQENLTAALTAQKEDVGKLEALFKTTTDALRDKIDDLKEVVRTGTARSEGGQNQKNETRATMTAWQGIVGTAAAIVALVLTYLILQTHRSAPVVTTPTVTITNSTP